MAYDLWMGWAGDRSVGHSPLDATTYFFSNFGGVNPGTATASSKRPIVLAGTLTAAVIRVSVATVLGSAETSTFSLRLNNTTDTTLSTAVKMDAVTQQFVVTGLSVALAQGDLVEIKFLTPTFVTNPTGVWYGVALRID